MPQLEGVVSVEESPEGGYEPQALGYAIFTQADTFDELREMVKDAATCHFEEEARPKVIRLHMVKDEVIAV
jgi:hypothetical protein